MTSGSGGGSSSSSSSSSRCSIIFITASTRFIDMELLGDELARLRALQNL